MIACRLLIELGMKPSEAIVAVRNVRPGAIETAAQLDYVMQLKAIAEPVPSRSRAAIADRALGAMLGLAVGDALGTTLEFSPRDSRPRLRGIEGGGPFQLKPGQWTDDTAMALALMDSLLHHPDLDETDLMQRFVSWHENGTYSCTGTCFDIGITTRQALARFKRRGDPVAGSSDPQSAGNGSLMRLAPVALRHWQNRQRLHDVAARQSRTTHAAPEAVDACVAFADLLADAIGGAPASTVLQRRTGTVYQGRIGEIMAGSWRDKSRDAICSTGYVAHSLEAALWCVARTSNFFDAILTAAELGEDADTTAAITGQLAGALYGATGITTDKIEAIASSPRLMKTAVALVTAGMQAG
ncbi:ADP-ribosylglycohydrolase family protein [uncultured Croceicoccus sp.]|uniref:ADP-ribosylglycohydrolase family protein n=1 Tax=uncultured Croceicoccus sp. TaxID=1295329 RepID=UPI002606192B|nr:ADP-ribosylglycohydrolase family protein [uncultured Croceicoccus sp.]